MTNRSIMFPNNNGTAASKSFVLQNRTCTNCCLFDHPDEPNSLFPIVAVSVFMTSTTVTSYQNFGNVALGGRSFLGLDTINSLARALCICSVSLFVSRTSRANTCSNIINRC